MSFFTEVPLCTQRRPPSATAAGGGRPDHPPAPCHSTLPVESIGWSTPMAWSASPANSAPSATTWPANGSPSVSTDPSCRSSTSTDPDLQPAQPTAPRCPTPRRPPGRTAANRPRRAAGSAAASQPTRRHPGRPPKDQRRDPQRRPPGRRPRPRQDLAHPPRHELLVEVPRTTTTPVARFKARKSEGPRHARP